MTGMDETLLPVPRPATPLPPAVRSRRKATTMDGVRVRRFLDLVEQGVPEIDAFWQVASDPAVGLSRHRGATERPSELLLRRKLAALLERTAPKLVADARNVALAGLAGLSADALLALAETVTGDFEDARAARARLDAAKTVLASLGIGERGMTIATQVNVGVSTMRGVPDGA